MRLDYPGDDLQYNVTINVADDRYITTKSHKRQSLAPNSLEACLEAADISPVFFTLVPGDQTSLMVDVGKIQNMITLLSHTVYEYIHVHTIK